MTSGEVMDTSGSSPLHMVRLSDSSNSQLNGLDSTTPTASGLSIGTTEFFSLNALASFCSVSNAVTKITGTSSMSSRSRKARHTSYPFAPPGIITSSSTMSGQVTSMTWNAPSELSARCTSYPARRKLRSSDDRTDASSSTTSTAARGAFRMGGWNEFSAAIPFWVYYFSVGPEGAFIKRL